MFEIKKYHANKGREGYGYDLDLWMDGKKVAHCNDDGGGGTPIVYWADNETRQKVEAIIKAMPPWKVDGETHQMDVEWFLVKLVDEYETKKAFVRQCKKNTLFRLKSDEADQYLIYKKPYTPQLAEQIRQHYGSELVEIINETIQA